MPGCIHEDKGRRNRASVHEDKHEAVHEANMWGAGMIGEISIGAVGEVGRVMWCGRWR